MCFKTNLEIDFEELLQKYNLSRYYSIKEFKNFNPHKMTMPDIKRFARRIGMSEFDSDIFLIAIIGKTRKRQISKINEYASNLK